MKNIFLIILYFGTALSHLSIAQGESDMDIDPIRTSFYVDKFQRNVILFGFGDSPAWSLELNQNKGIELLIEPDLKVISSIYGISETPEDTATIYFSKFDHGFIQFNVNFLPCQDKISGRNYHYQAEVHYHDTLRSDYRLLRGCVEWIPDFRLNDIWMLYQINDEIFDKHKHYKNVPRLEFHLNRMTVAGFGGCNEYQGKFEQYNNKVRIRNLKLFTNNSCELSPLEEKLMKDLQNEAYTFRIEDGYLTLYNDDDVYVFRRTD